MVERDSEICYIRKQLTEVQAWQQKKDQMLVMRFESWCAELETLLESVHSNLLQMVVLQLHLMILAKQHQTRYGLT